jgi:large subunit ribosomal protein L21
MYAIVEIAGQQFKVAKVTFDTILLLDDNGNISIGAPAIEGAAVTAKILGHLKGDKVIVFKKKRRKGYIKKNGHRQALSEIQIESIVASGAKKAAPHKEVTKVEVLKADAVSGDLSGMTVAELKALAKEEGISGYTSLKKAELIDALTK